MSLDAQLSIPRLRALAGYAFERGDAYVRQGRVLRCETAGGRVRGTVVGTQPYGEWRAQDGSFLRANGSFALGVAGRCLRLMGTPALDAGLEACRAALDGSPPEAMPAARARASEFALCAAAALVVQQGARAVVAGQPAARLLREATFLLVFGSRAPIREALLERLGHKPAGVGG